MPAAVNGMKECSKCGETKEVSEYSKRKNRTKGRGYHPQCRACNRARARQWNKSNKERVSEYNKQYHQDNAEAINERHRMTRENDPEEHKERARQAHARRRRIALAAVYEIENTITGKTCVGQSTARKIRWNDHKNSLLRGDHRNLCLQADYNEYGKDAFNYRVIQEYPRDTSSDVLLEHEQRVIDEYISEGKEVYNT